MLLGPGMGGSSLVITRGLTRLLDLSGTLLLVDSSREFWWDGLIGWARCGLDDLS